MKEGVLVNGGVTRGEGFYTWCRTPPECQGCHRLQFMKLDSHLGSQAYLPPWVCSPFSSISFQETVWQLLKVNSHQKVSSSSLLLLLLLLIIFMGVHWGRGVGKATRLLMWASPRLQLSLTPRLSHKVLEQEDVSHIENTRPCEIPFGPHIKPTTASYLGTVPVLENQRQNVPQCLMGPEGGGECKFQYE